MSLFKKTNGREAIEAELTRLRGQHTDAVTRLETAQAELNAADSVDDQTAAAAKLTTAQMVVNNIGGRISAAEQKLAALDRSALVARRDEVAKVLSPDGSGFADLTERLVAIELAARMKLAETTPVNAEIDQRWQATTAELTRLSEQLGEPVPQTIRDGFARELAMQAVVSKLRATFEDDRNRCETALIGLERENMTVSYIERHQRGAA
jgi:hypothetical protein